jgi:hypothetical protein
MKAKRRHKAKRGSGGLPFVAVAGAMAGFLIAYLAAQAALSPQAHLLHWLVAGSGAAMGAGLGYLWYRLRGDIG